MSSKKLTKVFFWDPALRNKSGYTDDGRLCNGRRFYMTFLLSGPVHLLAHDPTRFPLGEGAEKES